MRVTTELEHHPRQELALLARKEQERAANHYRPYASPDWHIDRLLLLHRQLERAQLDLLSLLSVAETAIDQAQDASRDQHNCHHLDCAHLVSSCSPPWIHAAGGAPGRNSHTTATTKGM